jgi:MFS family permease
MKPDLQIPLIYSPVFVLVAIGTQGIGNGRTLYLTEVATDHERPFCLAVSSALIGAIAVAMGAILGVLAGLQGVAWPILTMMGLNIAAALLARTLGARHVKHEQERSAPGIRA